MVGLHVYRCRVSLLCRCLRFRGIDEPPVGFRDPINKLYADMFAVYLPVLTTMLGIAIAREKRPAASHQSVIPFFWVALIISLALNLFTIWNAAEMSYWHKLNIQAFTDTVQGVQKASMFLITPILCLYFSSEHQ